MDIYLLASFFFIISILYSSAGFGGGSMYLAIMALAGVDLYLMRSTALMCNLIVVSGSSLFFYREGFLRIREAIIIGIFSVPMAFIGGYLPLSEVFIFILLGFSLLIASILLWLKKPEHYKSTKKDKKISKVAGVGAGIGLVSGMVGIGGGIFLSPVLNLINWDKAKYIAGLASFFILVNSIAGLLGQFMQNGAHVNFGWSWPLLLVVFIGGQIGSRLAIKKLDHQLVRRVTAVIIFIASMKILDGNLFHLL